MIETPTPRKEDPPVTGFDYRSARRTALPVEEGPMMIKRRSLVLN